MHVLESRKPVLMLVWETFLTGR